MTNPLVFLSGFAGLTFPKIGTLEKVSMPEKFGFVPNLSILDLLFNEGPNNLNVIERSVQ